MCAGSTRASTQVTTSVDQTGQDGQVPLVEATGELEVAIDEVLHVSHGGSSREASACIIIPCGDVFDAGVHSLAQCAGFR